MSRKDLSLRKYNVGTYRYRELYYHCLQYEEFKKNKETRHYAEQIEAAARDASPSLQKYILKNVTQSGMTFRYMDVPAGINQFYEARRKFFWILSQRLK